MPISVHWPTKVISVPQSYLTHLSGNLYELDIEQFRLDLKDLEDNVQGISYVDTHKRNAPVTLGGATYAQTFEIINDYTITFEAGPYAVTLVGANSNIAEVVNINGVSIFSNNSGGLVVTSGGGSGPTAAQIRDSVWNADLDNYDDAGTAGKTLTDVGENPDITQAHVGYPG